MIRIDRTPYGTATDGTVNEYAVATCTDCPHWHAFTWSYADARRSAATHEANVHPTDTTARAAARQYRSTHS